MDSSADQAAADRHSPRAVVVTGLFGTGKTSAVEDLAERLDDKGLAYAAIDLDWLGWANPTSPTHQAHTLSEIREKNLASVLANYLDAGIQYFLIAYAVRNQEELDRLKAVLDMPVDVVELVASQEVIKSRLETHATTGRQDDLRMAAEWSKNGYGSGFQDLTIDSEPGLPHVVDTIMARLSW
ncbi:MAG TPA: hypothetical protein VMT88_08080 [Actinomycetes bacterium]|nr:hypothetical protein [Actinomycetes bacterium]